MSQFAPRPFPIQDPQRPPIQEELENQASQRDKFEATELPLKEKYGTIFSHDFAQIPVHAPGQHVSALVQPRLSSQWYGVSLSSQRLQPVVASKWIGDPRIQAKSNIPGDHSESSAEPQPNKTGLPDNLKRGVENLSGYSLDDVRVHFNSPKPAQLQALAYTQGTDIHVASGQEEHLPHETWHVVQQADDRVKPIRQLRDGVLVNDDEGLEHEADVMGRKALQVKHSDQVVMRSTPALMTQDSESSSLPFQRKIPRDLMSETRLVSSDLPSNSFDQVVQCRLLDEAEQKRLEIVGQTLKDEEDEYTRDKNEIQKILQSLKQYGANNEHLSNIQYLYNRMDHKLPELDKFFRESDSIAAKAPNSISALHRLEKRLKWYQQSSDGKNVIKLTLEDLGGREQKSINAERDNLVQITGLDEKFFVEYLQRPKPPVTVYRGDGRQVGAQFLDDYVVQDILAGGQRDISFYGVVQHTHSSAYKNGMVSTTTDRPQAYSWAMDGHNYGVVYEFRLTNYIDVAELLQRRNFKNRFPAQMEILVPGNIDASDFVSVSLYGKQEGLIKKIAI